MLATARALGLTVSAPVRVIVDALHRREDLIGEEDTIAVAIAALHRHGLYEESHAVMEHCVAESFDAGLDLDFVGICLRLEAPDSALAENLNVKRGG